MNVFIAMFVWIGPPIIVMWLLFRDARNVILKSRHDKILYAFCDVRDAIAIKAIKGEISESSRVFQFFYLTNAKMIHQNKDHGWCYIELLRSLEPWKRSDEPEQNSDQTLEQEIELADDETKEIVSIYVRAMFRAMLAATPIMLRDAIMFKLLSFWSKIPLISKGTRRPAKFGLDLAAASGAFTPA